MTSPAGRIREQSFDGPHSSHPAILVLPVQSIEEGYEVKGDQIRLMLHGLGLLPVMFFSAAEPDREELRAFRLNRFDDGRAHHRVALRDLVGGANAMLANFEQEAIRPAARALTTG
jgi:hypothetical protein